MPLYRHLPTLSLFRLYLVAFFICASSVNFLFKNGEMEGVEGVGVLHAITSFIHLIIDPPLHTVSSWSCF